MKIFIAGPRAVSNLDENILIKITNICEKNFEILIGDAEGIDKSIQKILSKKSYKKVTVFASNGIARNNCGDWKIENVPVDKNANGFDFYVQKDIQMAKKADIGFMIWNGKSKGTFNNIINLLKMNKEVILYYVPNKKFYKFNKIKNFIDFLNINVRLNSKLRKLLPDVEFNKFIQSSLF